MIGILNYGIGNIGSIKNMLSKVGQKDTILLNQSEDFEKVDKIILPGVGAFDQGMTLLNKSGMRESLDRNVLEYHKPILGICLGMQMLGMKSEEGNEMGLGYINFNCKKFQFKEHILKVPHMGWDYVNVEKINPMIHDLGEKTRFYFVHSYYAVCADNEDILLSCDYGFRFTAAVHHDNVYGTQFHPEKSHIFGMKLLKNFAEEI